MVKTKKTQGKISLSNAAKDEEMKQLKERVKELNCLYALTKILRNKKLSTDITIEKIIEIIPPSWQYPKRTCVRIRINSDTYTSDNFKETPWKLVTPIKTDETIIGAIEIYYLEEKSPEYEGPFLQEERWLLDTIADQLGKFLDERRIKEELEEQKKKLDVAEKIITKSEPSSKQKKGEGKQDWEVIIDLLIKTDPRMLLRITRKMVYYLYRYENEKITHLLGKICPVDRDAVTTQWCGINMPNPRQDLKSLKKIQHDVFEIARESLSPEELSNLFHSWMKQDKTRPLLLLSQRAGIPLVDITNELIGFFEKEETETILAPEDRMSIKTSLMRRFFTNRLKYVNAAKNFIEVEDFIPLLKHVIGPSKGSGKLGGKTSGVFLAEKIIKKEMEIDDSLKNIRFPKSWYLSSDTIIEFIHYNDLDEIFHHKYLDPKEIRQEQPFLEQIFKNAVFPPEIIEGFRRILRDLSDTPIIVRSSSLLEDSFGAAFSGKYKSLFVPNTGTEEERLNSLMDAIAEVYSSTFGPDPIEYRRERGLLDYSEEMGVLIQEVIGKQVGPYFLPTFAGVAFSRNEFRWSPRIRREDGVIRLVPGLGTRAVDRVGNDYPTLISPHRPTLQVNTLINEKIKYSPHYIDAINLESGAIETIDAVELFKKYPNEYPDLDKIVSMYKDGRLVAPKGILFDPAKEDLVITFDNLFKRTSFIQTMRKVLNLLENQINTPVDVEFASDGNHLYMLQCRPQSQTLDSERKPIPKNIPSELKIFSSNKYVTTGQIENIEYIVYVKPEAYTGLEKREEMTTISIMVGTLNEKLPRRRFILMGPGRWGSRGDIKLGVPVKYRDINNTSLLVEIAKEKGDYTPELSFGTHFFQDLVEADIKYLPLYPDQPDNMFHEDTLLAAENKIAEFLPNNSPLHDVIHVVKVDEMVGDSSLSVIMDGEAGEALAYIKPPDHWNWRMKKVEELAQKLDADIYGVESLYLIGSTKDGTAGPASDIDLLVHFKGTEEQRDKLTSWFEQWSRQLDRENKERTGYETGGLLDVHIITDDDIEHKTSWAAHLTSTYRSVKKIPVRQSEDTQ